MLEIIKPNEIIKKTQKGVSVVRFHASWCGPCKMLTPVIEGISEEENDYKFFELDIDDNDGANKEMASEMGVTGVPTMFFFKDGKNVSSMAGFQPKEKIIATLESL